MAVLEIVTLPDPRLRIKSTKVETFDSELKKLVKDMSETMIFANGIGLAAVQVGVHKRLLVLDLGDLDESETFVEGDEESEKRLAEKRKKSHLEVYINPEIISSQGETEYEEGCLSVPGVYSKVCRKNVIKVKYQDIDGKSHTIEATGLRSIVLQHEIDHLEGVVFTDRLGPIQRMMVLKKYEKLKKQKEKDEA
jgi:peptide deformylase